MTKLLARFTRFAAGTCAALLLGDARRGVRHAGNLGLCR